MKVVHHKDGSFRSRNTPGSFFEELVVHQGHQVSTVFFSAHLSCGSYEPRSHTVCCDERSIVSILINTDAASEWQIRSVISFMEFLCFTQLSSLVEFSSLNKEFSPCGFFPPLGYYTKVNIIKRKNIHDVMILFVNNMHQQHTKVCNLFSNKEFKNVTYKLHVIIIITHFLQNYELFLGDCLNQARLTKVVEQCLWTRSRRTASLSKSTNEIKNFQNKLYGVFILTCTVIIRLNIGKITFNSRFKLKPIYQDSTQFAMQIKRFAVIKDKDQGKIKLLILKYERNSTIKMINIRLIILLSMLRFKFAVCSSNVQLEALITLHNSFLFLIKLKFKWKS